MRVWLFCIIPLLLLVGCVQQPQGQVKIDSSNGIIINEFSAYPTLAEYGEDTISVWMDIENVGGTTARNIVVELTGLSGFNERPDKKTISELSPPDIVSGTPGDFKSFEWELTPINVGEGIKHTFNVIGRVSFDYTTTAVATIPVYSKKEYRRLQERGQMIKDTIDITNTHAPVKVYISGEVPFVARHADEEAAYRIEFVNVGAGVPNTNNVEGLIGGKIRLTGPVEFSDCFGVTSGNEITLDVTGNDPNKQIKIRKGESAKKGCSIKLIEEPKPQDTITFTFDLSYRYYVQSEVPITIIGALETS